jgi:hypothetical protein
MVRFTLLAVVSMSLLVPYVGGCSHEVAHSEQDRRTASGARVHEESTTYKNPDGTYTTEKSRSRTSN